jgi:hypothetical protein
MIAGSRVRCEIALLSAMAFIVGASSLLAQETVFSVPSADVLDRGKIYGELDFTYRHDGDLIGVTPRVVVGAGHNLEVGLNLNGFGSPGQQHATPTPTVKWKFYDGKSKGWAAFIGDDVFIPVQNRLYDAGNYLYAQLAHTWKSGTRATMGGYHFSRDVVSSGQRAGGQFAIEQPLNKKVTFATDWFTGSSAVGYVTPGLIIKITPKITGYATYQIGNKNVSNCNHQLLVEIGWNPN